MTMHGLLLANRGLAAFSRDNDPLGISLGIFSSDNDPLGNPLGIFKRVVVS
jgi:hypothetical protein